MSLNGTQKTNNTVSIIKEQEQPVNDDDEYGDEYYEEEEEEEEDGIKKLATGTKKPQDDSVSNDSMDKIRRIVESQAKIPRLIIIKDA